MTDREHPDARAYYDDFSHSYEKERARGYHALVDELESSIVLPLARDQRVLEAGCGTGLILERVDAVASEAWGFDLSPGMAQKARARGLRVALGSVTEVPFADASFDLVYSFKVLAHVPDIARAIAELTRVTRPGGHLVLEFYNKWSVRYVAKRLGGPGKIGRARTEADVFTRWEPPGAIRAHFPPDVEIVEWRGVRVVTPAAFVHRVPVLGRAVAAIERAAVDSPLRWFGGFLIAIARKRG
jgi:ubiquinone/menaquinone biosynthesis C-methylase UbiE